MRLIDRLEQRCAAGESYFTVQLLREDVVRLKKLQELAHSAADEAAYRRAGARMGWTAGDARTGEIREQVDRLIEAIYALETAPGIDAEAQVEAAWQALHRARLERLLGCLSTPVPKPGC